MVVGLRVGRRLEFLRFAIFGLCVRRGIRVLGLQLLHPHLCIQASFEEQLLVAKTGRCFSLYSELTGDVAVLRAAGQRERKSNAYHPRSAIRPSLITRIWSAPMMVDSLRWEQEGSVINEEKRSWRGSCAERFYRWATTTVVRLVQILAREAWMFRSVCVSSADVAWRQTQLWNGKTDCRGIFLKAFTWPYLFV